jgi:hypothetical protein
MLLTKVYGIVGARDWVDYDRLASFVDEAIRTHGPPAAFVSGGADDADKQGERYAMERYGFSSVIQDYDCASLTPGVMNVFKPEWEGPGDRFAGLRRNTLIAQHCDVLVALPTASSKGTYDTIRKAKALGKVVIVADVVNESS